MSGSIYVTTLVFFFPFEAIYIAWMTYISFRAFKIRKSELVHKHRFQALWVGASAIYWIVQSILYLLVPFLFIVFPQQILEAKIPIAAAAIASLYFGLAFSFAWTDAIVPIARSSDPHNRDKFRWHYSRVIIWAVIAIGFALGGYVIALPVIGIAGTGILGPVGLGILFWSEIAPFFISVGLVIAIVLLVSYSHSADKSLRSHLKWLIAYDLVLMILGLSAIAERSNISNLNGNVQPEFSVLISFFVVTYTISYIQAFCLQMCVRSLAPINRFPPQTLESKM